MAAFMMFALNFENLSLYLSNAADELCCLAWDIAWRAELGMVSPLETLEFLAHFVKHLLGVSTWMSHLKSKGLWK